MYWLKQRIDWCERTEWALPAHDGNLVHTITTAADIDHIMTWCRRRRVCVQAGGAIGIWPRRFACFFERVITFEPVAENYACLVENISGVPHIEAHHMALGATAGTVRVQNDLPHNWGAGYTVPAPEGVAALPLDAFCLSGCDLIQLDVEGAELEILQGAEATIDAFRPVIVLEEKWLQHVTRHRDAARQWLATRFGYGQCSAVGRDVILIQTPRPRA